VKALDEQVKQQKVELIHGVASPERDRRRYPVHMGDRVTVSTMLTTIDEPGALAYVYFPPSAPRT